MRHYILPALLLVPACATPLERPANVRIGGVRALATPADVRIITDRPHPDGSAGNILCAEPSPDVAKALSTLFQISASAKSKTGATGSLGGGGSTAESVSLLAGRTVSVVALRDGVFRACEAYGNRLLNRNAYSLILSQYGDLLVTLTLGEAAAGAAAIGESRADTSPQAQRIDVHLPALDGAATPAAGASSLLPSDTTPLLSLAPGEKPSPEAKEVAVEKPAPAAASSAPSTNVADAVLKIVQNFSDSEFTRHRQAVFAMCVNSEGPTGAFEDAVCRGFLESERALTVQEIRKRAAEADRIAAEARLANIKADQAEAAAIAGGANVQRGR